MTESSDKQPSDEVAERALLGSILIESSSILVALDTFGERRPFHNGRNSVIWDAMRRLHTQGIPIDYATVTSELQRAGTLERVGGVTTLWEIENETPSAANIAYYAQRVYDMAIARELIVRAQRLVAMAQGDDLDMVKMADAARAFASAIPDNGGHVTSANLYDIREYFGNVSWGWQPWIPNGHLTLIAGVTGIGKSYLASMLMAAFTGAQPFADGSHPKRTGRVLLIETEEFRGAFAERLSAMGVQDDAIRLPAPRSDLTYLPNLATDAPLFTSIAQTEECVAIVVDSLSGGHAMDENSAELRTILQTLSQIASVLSIPVVIVHHLRKRSSLEPANATLDRVRGSSVITQFVRSVLGLWKPVQDDETVRVESLKCSFAAQPPAFGFRITPDGLTFCDAPEEPRSETAVDRAVEFLRAELRREPQRFGELLAKAEPKGISKNSLYRAREALRIVVVENKWGMPAEREE